MLAVQTAQGNFAEFSRCSDQSQLTVEQQKMNHRAEKADASMAEKVDRALEKIDVLRRTDYGEIDIAVKDGVVFLSGHVVSTTNQRRAETAARSIPGVLDVKSYLVSDD